MDEQKFREGMDLIKGVLKIFVDAKKDNGETFINELNKFDKSFIDECLSHRSSKPKSNEKVNGVRVDVLRKLSGGSITFNVANEIFEKSKKDYNYENRKLFGVLYPIYYYKYDNLIKNFLDNLEESILNDLGIDGLKSGGNDFNGGQNQGTDKIYLGFFNGTHPSWESAIQFRVQSKGSNKLIIGLFKNKEFIDGKFNEFSIDSITYQDILEELNKYKNEILNDKMVGVIDYIKENIDKFADIKEKAEQERKAFNEKFPLEKLRDLSIEDYNYGMGNANKGSFTWYLNTDYAIAGWLFSNGQNRLFYKGENGNIQIAKVMNDYLEKGNGDIKAAFQIYKNDLYDFIKGFNIETYNPNDFLVGANYIKASLIFLYKGDILVSLGLPATCRSIATALNILPEGAENTKNTDIIQYDIIISKYLREHIPEIIDKYGFSAIGKCLDKYHELYLMKQSKQSNIVKSNIDYYAVGAFLGDIDEKQEFYNRNKLIVGWQELGNLKNYNDDELVKKFEALGYKDTLLHFKQTFKDFKKIKKGDIVCLKSVNIKSNEMYIYAVGVVQGGYDDNYEFLPGLGHSLPVKWKILNEKSIIDGAKYQKTLSKINDDEIKKMLDRLLTEGSNLSSNQNQMIDLNTILYGVPGTGKTYNTINYAVAIIENKPLKDIQDESNINREAVRNKYKDYVKSGQIVFTTFHQSFGYEDFVEGIKAEVEEGGINYKIKDGIFKELCSKISKGEGKNHDNFEESWGKLVDELNEKDIIEIPFISGKGSFKVELNEYGTGLASRTYENDEYEKGAWIQGKSKFFSKEQLYNIYKGLPGVPAGGHDNYRKAVVNEMKKHFGLNEYQENLFTDNNEKRYVLIIDEINRGNISKIFGELITLLEPDKRLGGKEELKVKLPYSNDEFGVPSNLYVLGTMNTADRSIALIDLALRRRFKFREIEPNSELLNGINVEGINVKQMFETINNRIELLYDRDHLLGHAYFLPLEKEPTLEKLNSIILDNIIPLLQEYFHDDWEKIQMILGDHDNQSFKEDSDKIIQKKKNFDSKSVLGFYDDDIEGESFEINTNLTVNSYLGIYKK